MSYGWCMAGWCMPVCWLFAVSQHGYMNSCSQHVFTAVLKKPPVNPHTNGSTAIKSSSVLLSTCIYVCVCMCSHNGSIDWPISQPFPFDLAVAAPDWRSSVVVFSQLTWGHRPATGLPECLWRVTVCVRLCMQAPHTHTHTEGDRERQGDRELAPH